MKSSRAVLRSFLILTILTATCLATEASMPAADWLKQSYFEENKGQHNKDIAFSSRLDGYNAVIQRDGSLTLLDPRGHVNVRVAFGTSHVRRALIPSDAAQMRSNYFRGTAQSEQYTDIAHYAKVSVVGVYPGIDLEYHIEHGKLEFDFILNPGADPQDIALDVDGTPSISSNGDLLFSTAAGVWTQHKPTAYQDRNGNREQINCEYRLSGGGVRIALGPHDSSARVVVDPVVDYSSYLGGTGNDSGRAIAIGADGSIYVAGRTSSTNFPVVGAADSTESGADDAFIAKINPATGKLVYATYLGGSGSDYANAIAVDSSGSAYVTGYAESRFPTTTGAYQTSTSSPAGFVTKLSPAGNAMTYSTLLLGTNPLAIAVDSQGRAAVTGKAISTAFVPSAGAFQTSFRSAFVTVMNSAGSGVAFSTYLGGGNVNVGSGVAFDTAGKVVVAGYTEATDFPVVGGFQSTLIGTEAGFVTALNPDGKSLAYSTYLGGSSFDTITGMSLDPYGNIVVAGLASSDDFPTVNARVTRAMLANTGSLSKPFVAKIGVSPMRLIFSTFIGSTATCCESAYGVATDQAGEIYALSSEFYQSAPYLTMLHPVLTSSWILSKEGGFPNAAGDIFFVTALSRDGQRMLYQTVVAACGMGGCLGGIGARNAGYAAVTTLTNKTYQPISAIKTQAALAGTASDAIVMTLALEPPALDILTGVASPAANTPVTLTAMSYGATSGTVSFLDGATVIGTASLTQGIATLSASFSPGVHKLKATLGSTSSSTILLPVTLPNS